MESTIEITPPQVALALSLLFVSVLFLRRFVVKSSLDNVPGPARTSWFSGRSFMPSQVNATHSQPHCPGNMNEYFAPDCWEYRDELGRKYPRVAPPMARLGLCTTSLLRSWTLTLNRSSTFSTVLGSLSWSVFSRVFLTCRTLGTLLGPGLLGTLGGAAATLV